MIGSNLEYLNKSESLVLLTGRDVGGVLTGCTAGASASVIRRSRSGSSPIRYSPLSSARCTLDDQSCSLFSFLTNFQLPSSAAAGAEQPPLAPPTSSLVPATPATRRRAVDWYGPPHSELLAASQKEEAFNLYLAVKHCLFKTRSGLKIPVAAAGYLEGEILFGFRDIGSDGGWMVGWSMS